MAEIRKTVTGKYIVSYPCPRCREQLTSDLQSAGQVERCPDCDQELTVPGKQQWVELQKRQMREKAAKAALKEQRRAKKLNARNHTRPPAGEQPQQISAAAGQLTPVATQLRPEEPSSRWKHTPTPVATKPDIVSFCVQRTRALLGLITIISLVGAAALAVTGLVILGMAGVSTVIGSEQVRTLEEQHQSASDRLDVLQQQRREAEGRLKRLGEQITSRRDNDEDTSALEEQQTATRTRISELQLEDRAVKRELTMIPIDLASSKREQRAATGGRALIGLVFIAQSFGLAVGVILITGMAGVLFEIERNTRNLSNHDESPHPSDSETA